MPFLQQLHHNGTVHFVSLLLYRLCKSPKLNKDFYQRVRKSHEAGSIYAAYCLYTRQQASSFITLYNHKKRGLRKIEAFHLCQIIENMQIDAHEIWDYKPYDMYLHKILKQPNYLEHISLPPRFSWWGVLSPQMICRTSVCPLRTSKCCWYVQNY